MAPVNMSAQVAMNLVRQLRFYVEFLKCLMIGKILATSSYDDVCTENQPLRPWVG